MNEKLSSTASLLGDQGRAAILLRLMSGLALPAGELAVTANVAPQTASEHLGKLVEGRLLNVERQGRPRYYRLASPEVADAVEALLVLTGRPGGSKCWGCIFETTGGEPGLCANLLWASGRLARSSDREDFGGAGND